MTTVYELVQECDRTPGLEAAIRSMAASGACGMPPNLLAPFVKLGILSLEEKRGAELAREYVAAMDEYCAALAEEAQKQERDHALMWLAEENFTPRWGREC